LEGKALDPKTQEMLSLPVWGDVLKVLRDDMQRAYRIDIETNSTIEPEAAEDQKNISELMNALAQYLNGVGPMVAKGVMPFEAAQSMLLAISRRFRFGNEVEDYIKQMTPPKDESGAEREKILAEQQAKKEETQVKSSLEVAKMQHEDQIKGRELQGQQAIEMAKIESQKEIEVMRLAEERQKRKEELQSQRDIEKMKADIQRDTAIQVAKINASKKENGVSVYDSSVAGPIGDMMNSHSSSLKESFDIQKQTLETVANSILSLADSLKNMKPKSVSIVRDANGMTQALIPN
jgi:hypothetical protein